MDVRWPLRASSTSFCCRNVIIYFDLATYRRLTLRLGERLANQGYLILGHSEHPTWLDGQFQAVGHTVYRRKAAAGAATELQPRLVVRPAEPPAPPRSHLPTETRTLQRRSIISGEYFAAATPTEITTGLGSCVAACLFDPQTRIGGMNHFMLPEAKDAFGSARYGVHAMELLINAVMKLGGDRRRLRAKVFGGSNVLCQRHTASDVGGQNCRFIRQFLETEKIPVAAQRLGGNEPLRVVFHSHRAGPSSKPIPRLCQHRAGQARCGQCPLKQIAPLPQGDVTLF